jgi:esterase
MERSFTQHNIQLGQVGLHYLDWAGDKPAILLLHPTQMVAYIWARSVEASNLTNRFIAPDQRGHGHSDYPVDGYTRDDYIADDLALMDDLELKQVVLVGAATGANLALLMASRYPERFRGLVVVNPALNVDSKVVEQMQLRLHDTPRFATFEEATASLLFAQRWDVAARERYSREAFVQVADGSIERRCSLSGVIATYHAAAANLWTQIRVVCPTLLVRGLDSPFFPESDMQQLQAAIPGSHSVTLPDTGQLLMQDNPVAFAQHLDAFVRRLS